MSIAQKYSSSSMKRGLTLLMLFMTGTGFSILLFVFSLELTLARQPIDIEPALMLYREQAMNAVTLQELVGYKINFYLEIANLFVVNWAVLFSGLLSTAVLVLLFGNAGQHVSVDKLRYYIDQEKRKRKQAEDKAASFDLRLITAHEEANEGLLLLTPDMRLARTNRYAENLLQNWNAHSQQLAGQHLQDIVPGFNSSGLKRHVQLCVADNLSWEGEILLDPVGTWFYVRLFMGNQHVFLNMRDITHRKQPKELAELSHGLLQQLAQTSPVAFAIFDKTGHYIASSSKWIQQFNLGERGSLIGRAHRDLLASFPEDFETLKHNILKNQQPVFSEGSPYQIAGKEEMISWAAYPWRNPYGETSGVLMFANIITGKVHSQSRQKEQRAQERQLAYHDALTGLPNRQLFYDRLNMALAQGYRQLSKIALLFLDLDGFKAVNDKLGHDAGDKLLQIVAERLKECVRDTDTVARLGGDEFTVILTQISEPKIVASIADKILAAITKPITLGEETVKVGTSIGIGMYPTDGTNVVELIKCADTAMYRAKEQGKGCYIFYADIRKDVVKNQQSGAA